MDSRVRDDIHTLDHAPGIRLHGGTAMLAAAVVLALAFNLGNLPAPLYVQYRELFGFSKTMLTVVYAAYVLGTLVAMIVFGRLSDQIGRRPVLYIAIAAAALAALVFLFAANTAMLIIARVISGFSIGLTATAGAAWIAELQPSDDEGTAAAVTTGGNMLGLGLGPFITGVLAQYLPWPLHLTYLVYLVGLGAPALVVWTVHETVRPRTPLRRVSLRPRIGVPRDIRPQFVAPAVTAFVSFALMGFYSALVPSLLNGRLDIHNLAVSGAVIFVMFGAGVITAALGRHLTSRTAMFAGLGLFIAGVGVLVAADSLVSLALLVAATVVGGTASALSFRGALQVVNEIAPDDRRAETVAALMVVAYVGLSVPIIGIGVATLWLSQHVADLAFAGVLCLLALTAIVIGWRMERGRAR